MTYFQFLHLVGSNLDVVEPLAGLIQHRQTVSGIQARWNVDKEIGDLLVPRIAQLQRESESVTAAEAPDETTAETVLLEKLAKRPSAQAWDGSRLRRLFEIAMPIVDLFVR
ncbi:hypothetical protein [Blastopirellula retiformator]|uniref:Uncharacterized protein n=1 Tax=Blastopirellula retiformator TaxID=2527970 RepID=A0A5C5VJD8_9BACT|nr:hypothetical protein [Blastopirellula retiformator]TWT38704.1 hypothetical protein Enr8_03980 [Blastopirellula retiformator]